MFADILPGYVRIVVADEQMWTRKLAEEEETCIANAVEKRKREFRAGRNCAKQALSYFEPDRRLVVERGSMREPLWPAGYVGSITHTNTYCAAAVAQSEYCRSIGIDVEKNCAMDTDITRHICTEREREWLCKARAKDNGGEVVHWAMLYFSIKEAIYKAFHPIYKEFLDFQEAEVYISREKRYFHADIHQKEKDIRLTMVGRFYCDRDFVYSAIAIAAE